METTSIKIEGKKISELIEDGIIANRVCDIPCLCKEAVEYEAILFKTDAYKKYYSMLTKIELTGSEKQIAWAKDIRAEKAKALALELVKNLHIYKIEQDFDFNKYAKDKMREFIHSSAGFYIDSRYYL